MSDELGNESDRTQEVAYLVDCEVELAEYRKPKELRRGRKLRLDAKYLREDQVSVYNPSIIFRQNGEEYIAARVEPISKEGEVESLVLFFRRDGEEWTPLDKPIFELQDPNITWIDGQMVFSGTEIKPGESDGEILYRSVFYAGKDFNDLDRKAEGPWGMKGIRLVKLIDGKIGVYTRPQGEKGRKGQIGFTTVDSLEGFFKDAMDIVEKAPLLSTRFPNDEWGGVNQVIQLPDGRNLIIGHRAYKDDLNKRHYYPWAFIHEPFTGEIVDLGILAERSDFPPGPAKAHDLEDVVYPAGIVKRDGKWFLIAGLSDTQAGEIEIEDPLNSTAIGKEN